MDALPRLISLVGPTSSGKSRLALELAQKLDGEIVSADSRQIYRGLDIGTAKPTPTEQARVPHHLIDLREPDEPFSLAEYQSAAFPVIDGILRRGRLPLLVGGTGLYHRAVIDNLQIPEVAPQPKLRAELSQQTTDQLAERLRRSDPETAAQIELANPRRVIRALEVLAVTGQGMAAHRVAGARRYDVLKLGLAVEPDELRQRIRTQVERRYEIGVADEVRGLLDQGYDPAVLTERAIAYGPILRLLDGELAETEAIAETIRLEAAYAKRQRTWFRRDPEIIWLDDPADAMSRITAWLTRTPAEVTA